MAALVSLSGGVWRRIRPVWREKLAAVVAVWAVPVLTGACGLDAPSDNDLADLPRFSEAQASAAIQGHQYVCRTKLKSGCGLKNKDGDVLSAGCHSSDLTYLGKGIWDCGSLVV